MSSAVAFLRGINVGGRAKVPMAELRSVASDLGLRDVRTYLQSGNVVFDAPTDDIAGTGTRLEAAIEEAFDLEVRVVLRTVDELDSVATTNPFLTEDADFKTLHVVFLDHAPGADLVAELDPDRSPPDEFVVISRDIFLRYPKGSGRSKLNLDYFERRLGVTGTARNWNTVTKLLAMMDV